jgi:site-specific DNA-methyltransferase (adenine-specific)
MNHAAQPWKRREVIGNATLYLGDCLEVLRGLGDGCQNPDVSVEQGGGADIALPTRIFDSVITDPPYGVGFKYAGYEDSEAAWFAGVLPAVQQAISMSTRAAVFMSMKRLFDLPRPRHMVCWAKPGSTRRSPVGSASEWEPICIYGGWLRFNDLRILPDIVSHATDIKKDHPCPKPLHLMTWVVDGASKKGETVLDPFMGSGTTGVACMSQGREFVGIEIEPSYFDFACERIENAQRQQRMFA